MKILWAVSSVGKGHIMRDIAIVNQLKTLTDVEIEWLAPDPAGDFLRKNCSKLTRLAFIGIHKSIIIRVQYHTHRRLSAN